MKKYHWVLFDADETLFDFDTFRGLRHLFSQHNFEFTQADFDDYQMLNVPLWEGYQSGKFTIEEVKTKRFVEWEKRTGIPAIDLNSQFMNSMAETCALLPGAQELLDTLKDKCKVGIVTNGLKALQYVRLEKTGVTDHIDLMVISEEVGVPKPNIAIFEHTFEKMKFNQKEHILMVGDNPHTDILGGINAGIDTCWYNWRQHPEVEGITPTYQVDCLHKLKAILMDKI